MRSVRKKNFWLVLGATFSLSWCQSGDSDAAARLERLQKILDSMRSELDSLAGALKVTPATVSRDTSIMEPIFTELIPERQKTLAGATLTPFRKTAAGFAFNPNMNLGMIGAHWIGVWGGRLDVSAHFHEFERRAAANISLLRSLHRFSVFGGLETHLYAFTGLGFDWRRVTEWVNPPPVVGLPVPSYREWYGTSDRVGRWQMGAGTELGLGILGGISFTPEVGLQASRFFGRYQESGDWQAFHMGENIPRTDFSLDTYYAFRVGFYFQ